MCVSELEVGALSRRSHTRWGLLLWLPGQSFCRHTISFSARAPTVVGRSPFREDRKTDRQRAIRYLTNF